MRPPFVKEFVQTVTRESNCCGGDLITVRVAATGVGVAKDVLGLWALGEARRIMRAEGGCRPMSERRLPTGDGRVEATVQYLSVP